MSVTPQDIQVWFKNLHEVTVALKEFIANDWPVILVVVAGIAKVVNRLTPFWRDWKRGGKVVGFIVEVLDFIHLPKMVSSNSNKPNSP